MFTAHLQVILHSVKILDYNFILTFMLDYFTYSLNTILFSIITVEIYILFSLYSVIYYLVIQISVCNR